MSIKTTGYTVEQFKAWLDGIEEMQPKNWAPDAEQWKTIRKKINTLRDAPATVPSVVIQENPTTPATTSVGQNSHANIPVLTNMVPMVIPSDFDGTVIVPGGPLIDPTSATGFDNGSYQTTFK